MNIKKVYKYAFLLAVANLTANAHAAIPETCFLSANDYKIYQTFGEAGSPGFDASKASLTMDDQEYMWQRQVSKYGPPKKKPVSISVKQTQASSGATIYVDASPSVTPSGKATYRWGNGSTSNEYSTSGGILGATAT
ncbi:hypothetical protein CSV86_025850 [Pseudomonas putida CSV86]|uniref:Uncharacterized protein n=1 Tax=Pseudomonas bharatica CSV86 TaxID=1005395 RepID=A0A7K4EL50_9PSED|nr:hypothetical protein [Pseudomonas bharatica]NNJ18358.1 hypothetical protein [Pseudomonas bharatica CSV86]